MGGVTMNSRKMNTKSMILTGMFAAVLAVLSQLSIPMPTGVPVTLQTFAIALTGAVLGWKRGTLATLIYILLGAAGVPVFAEMSGGLGIVLGKTGGFIYGFLFLVAACGLGSRMKNKVFSGLISVAGLLICHLLGVIQFMIIMGIPFGESILLVSVPFLLKDAFSIVLAYVVGAALKRALNAAGILLYAKEG